MARECWPGQDPIGRRVSVSPWVRDATVVGVARDGKYTNLTEDGRFVLFIPWRQNPAMGSGSLIVRGVAGAQSLVGSVRDTISAAEPAMPIVSVSTLKARIGRTVMPQQFGAWLFGVFSALALVLAVFGTYGLVSYLVTRRTHEIGVRVALGAGRLHIVGLMLRSTLTAVVAGTLARGAGAWWTARFIDRFLFGITGQDAISLGVAAAALVVTGLGASCVPALRATRVDPVQSLRAE